MSHPLCPGRQGTPRGREQFPEYTFSPVSKDGFFSLGLGTTSSDAQESLLVGIKDQVGIDYAEQAP